MRSFSPTVTTSESIAGSFRDPSGYVFRRGAGVYRAIDTTFKEIYQALSDGGVLGTLMSEGLVVGTQPVVDADLIHMLCDEHTGFSHFLKHDSIWPITYPYEWSVSMLADAGILTLDLQMQLLKAGCSLKDASAFNIQFRDGCPVFIDLSSIERPARLDLWFALGQFNQMFTFPLLLARYKGWDLNSYFRGHLNGCSVERMATILGFLGRWRPRALLDVALPNLLNRHANRKEGEQRGMLERSHADFQPQLLNLQRLRKKLRKLAVGYQPQGVWADYVSTCTYNDAAERFKKSKVREFLETHRPKRVLDLGCNTGDYSFTAAECGATVLAVDGDHDAIELVYRRLQKQPADITPMIVDLGNPSPAIGFRNRERDSFEQRVNSDCVLALAIMHHLLVNGNIGLPAIRDLLWDWSERFLVLEFVPREDIMFRRLMKFRVDLFADLTLAKCRTVFEHRFRLIREAPIPDSPRTLLFYERL